MPHRLIIPFGEGPGEVKALPILMRRVQPTTDAAIPSGPRIAIDDAAWQVGHVHKLLKDNGAEWRRKIKAAGTRGAAGIFLLLDGDRLGLHGKAPICPPMVARELVAIARQEGAGQIFSLAVVIAMQEIESWFIAGSGPLIGRNLQRRPALGAATEVPSGNLEEQPRDAKGWLSKNMPLGYKATVDQERFARHVDLQPIRTRKIRSFMRFEHAVRELFVALSTGTHIATPQ